MCFIENSLKASQDLLKGDMFGSDEALPLFLLIILFLDAKINRLHGNARLDFLRQPLCKQGVPAARTVIAHGGKECRAVADEDDSLLRTRNGSVEEIALHHNVMRTHKR